MGRLAVVYFHVRNSEGGCPRLCQLRTNRLAPRNKIDYVLAHTGLWGLRNLVALTVAELDDTPPYLTDVQWDSVGATYGCLSRYRVKDLH
jgi:hypothetical protein